MSVVKISGDGYKKWGFVEEEPIIEEVIEEEPVVEEPVEEEPIVEEPIEEEPIEEEPIEEEPIEEEPVIEEPIEEEPIVEEPTPPKKCIVGIVWPESSNPERIYRYRVPEGDAEVGDTVSAPTFDSYNKKEVVRKARVVTVEYYDEGDDIVLPTKSIISIEKKSD